MVHWIQWLAGPAGDRGLLSRLEAPIGTKGGPFVPVGGSNRDKRPLSPPPAGPASRWTRDKSHLLSRAQKLPGQMAWNKGIFCSSGVNLYINEIIRDPPVPIKLQVKNLVNNSGFSTNYRFDFHSSKDSFVHSDNFSLLPLRSVHWAMVPRPNLKKQHACRHIDRSGAILCFRNGALVLGCLRVPI